MHKQLQLTGLVFNRLTVVQKADIKTGNSFWICQCSCDGLYSIFAGKSLTAKKIQSCGCLRRETSQRIAKIRISANTLPSGVAAFNLLYATYKFHARKRDFSFNLTKTEFRSLTEEDCFYCGVSPYQIYKNKFCKGDYTYNGVDRKNNDVGYTPENSVSCCGQCNEMKMGRSVPEFIAACRAVTNHHII